jgi:hypothetical protein
VGRDSLGDHLEAAEDGAAYLSEGSAVSVDMRPVIRRKNKRGAKRCERPDCPFCTRPNCGACRNCTNPAFKSKCIKRKVLFS